MQSGAWHVYGLYFNGSGSGEYDLERVHLEGEGGSEAYGLYCHHGSVHLVDAKVIAYESDEAIGLHGFDCEVTVQRSMIIGQHAAFAYGISMAEAIAESLAFVTNSEVIASSDVGGATVHPIITDSASTAVVSGSLLMGGSVSSSSTTCAGVYDENGTFYPSTCP